MAENLLKVVRRRAKRLGRGYGSGKGGHTSGRGEKGQKSRGKVGIIFEGVKMKKSLIKRLPFQRGRGKLKAATKALIINLRDINNLPTNSKIDIETLIKNGIVDAKLAKTYGVKLLSLGQVKNKYTVAISVSQKARQKIEKVGGQVVKA